MKLKKTLAILLTLIMATAACGMQVFAEGEGIEVFVTIANGELKLAQQPVTVTDTDGDGALTINDALYAAHETYYEGGAAAGYGSARSDYGLSLTMLWGADNGGSYGYYVNNTSAMSLVDPISEGDLISAFVYTDLIAWSDTYCYFDIATASVAPGEAVTVTLLAAGYDESWNPITVPVEGAFITVNGVSDVVTDAEGKAVVTVTDGGENVISAFSSTQTLVPPVCLVTVKQADTQPDAQPAVPSYIWISAAVVFIAAGVIGFAAGFRRNK